MKTYFSAQFVPGASPRNEFSFNNYAGGTEVKIIPVDDAITSGDHDTYINVALGTQTRGVVQINRDQVGPRQGVLAFESNDGTKWFLWMTNLGQLRRSSTDPRTADLGVAAAVIGP